MIIIDYDKAKEIILNMFIANKEGITADEIKSNTEFNPMIDSVRGMIFKVNCDTNSVLDKMTNQDNILIYKQGKYYLK